MITLSPEIFSQPLNRLSWIATTSHVSAGAGSPFEVWEAMGKPLNLSPTQLTRLRHVAEPAMQSTLLAPSFGALVLPFALAPNEFLHVKFRPQDAFATPKSDALSSDESIKIEAQLGEKSRD